ncbi:ABC transporter permease [Oleiagrimonas soli]|uniref:ABC transporter permease n=1 Tax=Oleiagrimonas soli TaxID=1543381 RepID=A0A099D014_9GAMM|nr:FtsX-like permease family protein [Oleiagrimonas soli]KGI78590.1 ABC transporter permease [Oleiagrimonas soli]MBB6184121.1 putative ABC transport system permease protein [Oleiagrimonas soli]
MELGPILSTLRRHKITAFLLVAEIALTCAIVCNAVFLISQRLERMDMPSGVAENQLVMVQVANIAPTEDAKARTAEDLAALRRIPGVKDAALVSQVPFTNSSSNTSIKLSLNQKLPTLNATQYMGENMIQTFGSQLVAGRDFRPDEYMDYDAVLKDLDLVRKQTSSVIITKALAERLWPGESALGKKLYFADVGVRVVGVVKDLVRPSLFLGDDAAQWSMMFPLRMNGNNANRFVLRVDPTQRHQVLEAAAKKLRELDPHRIILGKKTFDEIRSDFFRNDRAMAGTLVGVIIALLTVTALGIVGLASFWVAQRRRTIGVRRALGATQSNILRYFQTENFLLATIGIALGMALAWGINLFLMQHYELPRLPWIYLPVGAVALWLIGQLAVLGPALRASRVPPVVATRSV